MATWPVPSIHSCLTRTSAWKRSGISSPSLRRGEELLFSEVAARLPEPVRARLVALVEAVDDGNEFEDDDGSVVLASIRSDPGNVSLNTMQGRPVRDRRRTTTDEIGAVVRSN
jgi:hypothetical protein